MKHMNKFEQVSIGGHQMSLAGGPMFIGGGKARVGTRGVPLSHVLRGVLFSEDHCIMGNGHMGNPL